MENKKSVKEILDGLSIINISQIKKIIDELEYSDYNDYLDKLYKVYVYVCYNRHYEVINTIAQKVLDIINDIDDKLSLAKAYAIIVAFGTLDGLPEKTVEYGLKFDDIKDCLNDTAPFAIPIYSSMAAVFYANKFYKESILYTEKIFNEPNFKEIPITIQMSQYINYVAMTKHVENKKLLEKINKKLTDYFKKDKSSESLQLRNTYNVTILQLRNEEATLENNEEELKKVMSEFEELYSQCYSQQNIVRLVQQKDMVIDILKTFFTFKRYQFVIEKCYDIINDTNTSKEDLMETYRLLIASLEKMAGEASPKIVKAYNEVLYDYYESQTFLKQQMIEKSVELYNLENNVKKIIRIDALTNCFNRRYLNEFIKENRKNIKAVIFCDVDNFKMINDKYGHKLGDILLVTIVEAFNKYMPKNSAMFRIGGDEFVFISSLAERKNNEQLIKNVKEYLKETIDKNKIYNEAVDFSYGIYLIKSDDEDIEEAIDLSDKLMYANKSIK